MSVQIKDKKHTPKGATVKTSSVFKILVVVLSLSVINITGAETTTNPTPPSPFPESFPFGSTEAVVNDLLPHTVDIYPGLWMIDITGNPPPDPTNTWNYDNWLALTVRDNGVWIPLVQGWNDPDLILQVHGATEAMAQVSQMVTNLAALALSIGTTNSLFYLVAYIDTVAFFEPRLWVENIFIPEMKNGVVSLPPSATSTNIIPLGTVDYVLPGIVRAVVEFDMNQDHWRFDSTNNEPYQIGFLDGRLFISAQFVTNGVGGTLTLYAADGSSATYSFATGKKLMPLTLSLYPDTGGPIHPSSTHRTLYIRGDIGRPVSIEWSSDLKNWHVVDNPVIIRSDGSAIYNDDQERPNCFYRIRYKN